jgi:hypothetical protein
VAEHRWRWDSDESREFPYHDLVDVDGVAHPVVAPGDVVVTGSVELGKEYPQFTRLDGPAAKPRAPRKPRAKKATPAIDAAPELAAEPFGAEPVADETKEQ